MPSVESKVVALYSSALVGASLSELEVCRIGLWSCEPLRGAWIVQGPATPMLAILCFTPMNKRLLGAVSVVAGIGMFMLGFQSAHSEGSLTWPAHMVMLLFGGSVAALAIMGFLTVNRDRFVPPPPPLTQPAPNDSYQDLQFLSLKGKISYLYAGALAGGVLGQILIYGSVNDRSTFEYDKISFEDIPFLLILIVGGSATPIVILLSQLAIDKVTAIRCSLVVATLVLGFSVVYGQYDSLFGHNGLGYNVLWFASILAALTALTMHKRRLL